MTSEILHKQLDGVKSGIYCIFNAIDGKRYVGSSKNVENRIKRHFYELSKNIHHNPHLQNSWNIYGAESFDAIVIEIVSDLNFLISLEQFYIDSLSCLDRRLGYNIKPRADCRAQSEETKERISLINKGRKHTFECRLNMSKSRKGRAISEKQKIICREVNKIPLSDAQKLELVSLYNQNVQLHKIAKILKISKRRIPVVLEELCVPKRKKLTVSSETKEKIRAKYLLNPKVDLRNLELAIDAYIGGKKLKYIKDNYGINSGVLYRHLAERNIHVRKRNLSEETKIKLSISKKGRIKSQKEIENIKAGVKKIDMDKIYLAIESYRSGKDIKYIEDIIGVPFKTLFTYIKKLNIPLRGNKFVKYKKGKEHSRYKHGRCLKENIVTYNPKNDVTICQY